MGGDTHVDNGPDSSRVCDIWRRMYGMGGACRRPLSDPQDTKPTLEPKGQGLRFLGLPRNALGLGLILIGLALFVVYAWTD